MTYHQFLSEREKIDYLIEQGYCMKSLKENLSGSFVEFAKADPLSGTIDIQTLHITNADARKYFSSLLIRQLQKQGK
ncbi:MULTISPECIES: hypothetical protein [Geobacillus]|uniref:hypothetical protein n=1 Tax=Geobacillus TaxID=129337 RepID=UPI0009BDD85A|nr:hypothetical protein [Geobacillus sp. 46C-IIa]OQP04057.1 hypothetical protein B1690_16565 [Geobacillus sp. 46C-IIa]QNU26660.1 hypothetical protein IC803_10005 [Geobacillus sp. 46C-IIa]